MKIWTFCIICDEAPILPYFLRHYTTFADKLIFFDGGSKDGTREMIAACPKAELRDWPGSKGIVDDEFMNFANTAWKEACAKADWVIWVDADEFIYHPQLFAKLEEYLKLGVDHPGIAAYTMLADKFPTTKGQIYDEIKTGIRDFYWDKQAVFRGDIWWNVGRHSVEVGRFKYKPSDHKAIKLLHYRCLGIEYLRARHARNWARVPEHCRIRSFGANCSPGYEGHHGVKWFEEEMKKPRENVI